jgi:hypothetical protein
MYMSGSFLWVTMYMSGSSLWVTMYMSGSFYDFDI